MSVVPSVFPIPSISPADEESFETSTAATDVMEEEDYGWAGQTILDDEQSDDSVDEVVDRSTSQVKLFEELSRVVGELNRYRAYQEGWDGYNGKPFELDVLRRTGWLAGFLGSALNDAALGWSDLLITTGPASDGSLDLEVRVGQRSLFFTLYPETRELMVTALQPDLSRHASVEFSRAVVFRWVGWLVDKTPLPIGKTPDQQDT